MRKSTVVFELTDGEIRAFWFSVLPFRKPVHSSTIVKFDRIPIPTGIIEQGTVRDENVLIGILSKYGSQNPGKYRKVYLAISLQQGFIRAYTLPWLPKRDRKSAMSLLLDEEISIARSDLLYDFLVISEEKHKRLQVLLGATRRSILEQYAFILGQAGFKTTGVDFTFSVLGQVLGFEANEDVLYLQGETESFQMALFRGVVPESVRTVPSLHSKYTIKEDVRSGLEEWENETRRFLLYYQTQQTNFNLKRLVWSGNSEVNQLAQGLAALNHGLKIERATLKDIPDSWQKVIEDNQGYSEVAVGYGLRISTHGPGLNLWRQQITDQKVQQTYLGLAFFAAALLMAGTLIWFSLCQMALPLQQEITQLSHQGIRIQELNRNQEALASTWNKVSVLSEGIGEKLAQVQALSGTELKIEQVILKQGSLSVRGSANDTKCVQAMLQNLRALGWEDPSLTSYKLTALNIVEFTLSAKQGRINAQDSDMIK